MTTAVILEDFELESRKMFSGALDDVSAAAAEYKEWMASRPETQKEYMEYLEMINADIPPYEPAEAKHILT